MQPTFFGDPALFGTYHPPTGKPSAKTQAALLCPPVGHEHTRAHRAVRTLARTLSRQGHHVLRFDYRGMGESWGNPEDGGAELWCDDIWIAMDELIRRAGSSHISVVGLRLGAPLAVRALSMKKLDCTVASLVLWDPVLDGGEFLQNAVNMNDQLLNDMGRFPWIRRSELKLPPRQSGEELIGYSFPPEIRRSLRGLDLRRIDPWPAVKKTVILLSEARPEVESLASDLNRKGVTAHVQVVDRAEGAWDDYGRHERALQAGRMAQVIASTLSQGA